MASPREAMTESSNVTATSLPRISLSPFYAYTLTDARETVAAWHEGRG